VNYEVSQTEREITQAPGAIRRMTVAVLVNGTQSVAADGTTSFEPRTEDELTALRELVASAVGFDESRGDVITLKTMEFEAIEPVGTMAEASLLDKMAIDVMSIIQAAVLAIVALILGLFVVRPLLSRAEPTPLPQLAAPVAGNDLTSVPLTGEIDDGQRDASAMALVADGRPADTADLPALAGTGEDPVERLRALIGERQDETVEILRNWLEEEKAG